MIELNPSIGWDHVTGDMLLRIGVGTAVGLLLGFERELKGGDAGLRTHGIIALSASVMTVSVLLLYNQLGGSASALDPLRVVEGMAAAVGIIAAGLIVARGDQIHNLTSAAYVWLTATVGIASGAGQYPLVLVAAGIALVVIVLLRVVERWLPSVEDVDDNARRD